MTALGWLASAGIATSATRADKDHRGQGTGFAFGRDADGVLLVATCWHVVREIQPANLRINYRLPCQVVSSAGDDNLDLAVLRVPGLTCDRPLALAACGARRLPFVTYGYEPIGRPLAGFLGAGTSRPSHGGEDVPAWDWYLDGAALELEKIKDGYSGAPVYAPATGAVVAVITHRQGQDKGLAIDIGNLPRVYPQASACFAETQAESDGEYALDDDNPLAKILDHSEQLAAIRELLDGPAAPDRAIALVEACADDWPSYLADHVHLYPWPDAPGGPPKAIPLRLIQFDSQAFWRALIEAVPRAGDAPDEAAKRAAVRAWIVGADLRVLYFPVGLERHGRDLPRIVRGAEATLASLGDFPPGTRLLVLIACVLTSARPPFWWSFYARWTLAGMERCRRVAAMRLLDKSDVENWHAGFPHPLCSHYKRDRLKAELLALFGSNRLGIRYEQARHLLVDEGALSRARLKP